MGSRPAPWPAGVGLTRKEAVSTQPEARRPTHHRLVLLLVLRGLLLLLLLLGGAVGGALLLLLRHPLLVGVSFNAVERLLHGSRF
jgi:hypothetical protein